MGRPKKKQRKNGRIPKEIEDPSIEVANKIATIIGPEEKADEVDPLFMGLSVVQKTLVRLRSRGLTHKEIANIRGITPQAVSWEFGKIKEYYAAKGKAIDQDSLVGETVSIFNEIEQKAWDIVHSDKADDDTKLKAMNTVMSARERHTKLLMDIGRLDKAAKKVEHTLTNEDSTFISKLRENPALLQGAVKNVIEAHLTELAAPVPPSVIDDEISEAEIVEDV